MLWMAGCAMAVFYAFFLNRSMMLFVIKNENKILDAKNENRKQSKVTEYVKKKQECCGCGLCYEKCPKKAIQMTKDECGFLYPVIDREKCIECGICKKICAFQKENLSTIKACYAAVSCDKHRLKKSASGGLFSAIAESFLKRRDCLRCTNDFFRRKSSGKACSNRQYSGS